MPKTYLFFPILRPRLLTHPRRLGDILLPIGAASELAVALALRGLGSAEPWVGRVGSESHLILVATAIGAFLITLWLPPTGIGEGSPFKDLDLAHQSPNEVFQFRRSTGKVWACAMTIGLDRLHQFSRGPRA